MVLRHSSPWLLALSCAFSSGCCPDLPTGTSGADIASSGVTQGVVGKAVARTGDCSQCGPGSCSVDNIGGTMVFVPATAAFPFQTDAGECFVQLGSRRQGYLGRTISSPRPGATSVALGSGSFAVQLDAGTYWSLLQTGGCAVCFGAAEVAGTECFQTTVSPNAVTTLDVVVDVSN